MYLSDIHVENYGAIEHIEYKCKFDENGNPLPVVLIGRNGCGKTLLLSNIIHSLIEMKRKHYNQLPEVKENNYYRVSSHAYVKEGTKYSYVNLSFDNNKSYTDLMTRNYDYFKNNIFNAEHYKNIDINNNGLKENGFFNNVDDTNRNDIDNHVYLYFPVDRYYIPQWYNKENESPQMNISDNYVGQTKNNMICHDLLSDLDSWLLDVIMDKLLYEEIEVDQLHDIKIPDGMTLRAGYEGKNTTIQKNINNILTQLFKKNYRTTRIGISKKRNCYRKIALYGTKYDGAEEECIPSFRNLSSGEIMIFSIACKILKEYDRICNDNNAKLDNITGIVLIDEIDSHLHSDFSKDIAPALIKLFPKVQFIVSSHSPFFLLGMKDEFKDKCQFLSLPSGTLMEDIEHFEEIRKCYDLIDNGYEELEKNLESYKLRLIDATKPIIITEGKTDWKHIKNALLKFQEQNEFTDLDLEFYEYTFDMGDRLKNIITNIKDVPNKYKIIAVFDTDKQIVKENVPFEKLGNNVYQCAIPDPQNYGFGISVEMMYPTEDIKKLDNNNRRLFLTNEFSTRSGALLSNHSIICRNNALTDAEKKNRIKIVDFGVINVETDENIALSKEDFATNILNRIPPFDNINVDGFRSLFETIRQILNN